MHNFVMCISYKVIMSEVFSSFWFQSILKLLLGFFLAGIIGAERESVNKPAGFKTHSLIGVSAVLIMLVGEYLNKTNANIDPTRIPAQLLSGIGFVGAGTILRDGFNVKGLTTAASLLAVTCIGLSIGGGFYIGGIVCTIIIYMILEYSHSLFGTDRFNSIELLLKVNDFQKSLSSIQSILDNHNVTIKKIKNIQKDKKERTDIQLVFKYHKDVNINKVITEISLLDEVIELEQD